MKGAAIYLIEFALIIGYVFVSDTRTQHNIEQKKPQQINIVKQKTPNLTVPVQESGLKKKSELAKK